MIIKNFEINKINLNKNKFILFYGKNEGLKNFEIKKLFIDNKKIFKYDEKDILDNLENFYSEVLSGSLFDNEKIIIINRSSDKIVNIIEELYEKNINDITILVNAEILEKKSKLRSLFEKNKDFICVPFYEDSNETLSRLALNFTREQKISISKSNINMIVNKCNADRSLLQNELIKIKYFTLNNKNLSSENLVKLINLAENHHVSELVDNCLAKNTKKTISIINENNFSNDDCIIILRTILYKSKRLLKLLNEFEANGDLNKTISSTKPPIFWKDKEITKQQISRWSADKIKELIFSLSDIELQIKKNIDNSINLISNFILQQSNAETSN